jgi:hypothetical protein
MSEFLAVGLRVEVVCTAPGRENHHTRNLHGMRGKVTLVGANADGEPYTVVEFTRPGHEGVVPAKFLEVVRRGRPGKPPKPNRKRVPLGLRISPELKAKLVE